MSWAVCITVASLSISFAIVYYAYIKYRIHKAYTGAIERAVLTAVENRITELAVRYSERTDRCVKHKSENK